MKFDFETWKQLTIAIMNFPSKMKNINIRTYFSEPRYFFKTYISPDTYYFNWLSLSLRKRAKFQDIYFFRVSIYLNSARWKSCKLIILICFFFLRIIFKMLWFTLNSYKTRKQSDICKWTHESNFKMNFIYPNHK